MWWIANLELEFDHSMIEFLSIHQPISIEFKGHLKSSNSAISSIGNKNSQFHTEKVYNFAQLITIVSIVGSLVTFGILFLACPFCYPKGESHPRRASGGFSNWYKLDGALNQSNTDNAIISQSWNDFKAPVWNRISATQNYFQLN